MKNVHSRKKIVSRKDLAINGSPPAFTDQLHVGRPNIGNRDVFFQRINDILDRGWLTNNGPVVQEFEQRVADIHSVKNCVAMCNGTIALEIAIRALGLSGEVIIPSFTFIATAHALHWQAINPVFADINSETHNLDPASVEKMITSRTTGIIGVHIWGRPCAVEELQIIADKYNLKLMFDAAHAFRGMYRGTSIGTFGDCAVLSFHATKFFNTFEGGAVLTNNDELADTMRLMRNFGFIEMDKVIHPGTNGKMTEIAAAMGLVNIDYIDDVVKDNIRNYQVYRDGLSGLPGISLISYDKLERNSHQYVIMEVDEKCPVSRDQIIKTLHAENIRARRYFWPGCHNMVPYRELYPHAGLLLTNTQRVADKIVVLPTGSTLDAEMIKTVVSVIRVLIEDFQ